MHLVSFRTRVVVRSLNILIGLAALIYKSKCQATTLACQRQDLMHPTQVCYEIRVVKKFKWNLIKDSAQLCIIMETATIVIFCAKEW